MTSSRVLLLNGVGSAGKSSIAKSLQVITRAPFQHVAMDAFLDMLPAAYQDHPDGFRYETLLDRGRPSVAIHSGPVGERLMTGLRAAVAGLAGEGNDLIVDDVLFGEAGGVADYRRRLAAHDLMVVEVKAPLDVLEAREAARGDRLIGLALWQYGLVHAGIVYDFEVDTATASPEHCARRIRDRFDL